MNERKFWMKYVDWKDTNIKVKIKNNRFTFNPPHPYLYTIYNLSNIC